MVIVLEKAKALFWNTTTHRK